MKVFKLPILMIIALLFSASSMYSYYRDLEVVRYVSSTIKAVGWASSELEMEVLKFDHALTALAAGSADESFVQLRFELLWSRINTLLTGEESRPVREQPGVLPMLDSFSMQLARWEEQVYALDTHRSPIQARQQVMALRHELSHFRKLAREINVDSFSGVNAWQQLDIIQDIRLRSSLYLIGLLLSGGLMLLLLLRENRRNRYLAYHDVLTRLPNRMYFYQLINNALREANKRQTGLAVHMIDLNDFKVINDSLYQFE